MGNLGGHIFFYRDDNKRNQVTPYAYHLNGVSSMHKKGELKNYKLWLINEDGQCTIGPANYKWQQVKELEKIDKEIERNMIIEEEISENDHHQAIMKSEKRQYMNRFTRKKISIDDGLLDDKINITNSNQVFLQEGIEKTIVESAKSTYTTQAESIRGPNNISMAIVKLESSSKVEQYIKDHIRTIFK